jgi:hypothetical protein
VEISLDFILTKKRSAPIASGLRSLRKVWQDKPSQGQALTVSVTFVDVTDPYAADPLDPVLSTDAAGSGHTRADFGPNATYQSRSNETATHGLEALSAAASRDRGSFPVSQPSHHHMASTAISYMAQNLHHSESSPRSTRRTLNMHSPPSNSTNSTNNINFLLNPQNSLSPPIDPSLQSSSVQKDGSLSVAALRADPRTEQSAESDQEVAYLLHHFADAPGSWSVQHRNLT